MAVKWPFLVIIQKFFFGEVEPWKRLILSYISIFGSGHFMTHIWKKHDFDWVDTTPKKQCFPRTIFFKFVLQVAEHRLSICYLTNFLVDKDLRCEMAHFSFGCHFYLIFWVTNEYIIDVGIDRVCSCDIFHKISQGILWLSCSVA